MPAMVILLDDVGFGASSAFGGPDAAPDQGSATGETTFDFERTLMDADRTMLQCLQTSLSLIGLGITINTFFNNVARARGAGGEGMARDVGLGLLAVGIFLLSA